MNHSGFAYRLAETNKNLETLRELYRAQEQRLKLVEQLILNLPAEKKKVFVTELTVNLPDHLRRTYNALKRFPGATADQIAQVTARARAVESAYLNQFCIYNIAKKKKEGRKTLFSMNAENPPLEILEAYRCEA